MPMLTTWRSGPAASSARARTASAKASIASRVACTSSENGAAPGGARKAVCSTARPSVRLIASPESIASRQDSMPHSRASSQRKRRVAASSRLFEKSQNTSGASSEKRAKRAGSRANASRRSSSRPWAW
jgi:hypothetical protein